MATTAAMALEVRSDSSEGADSAKSKAELRLRHRRLHSYPSDCLRLADSMRKRVLYGSDDEGGSTGVSCEAIQEVAHRVAEQAEDFVRHVWKQGWKVVSHHSLPAWLKDNDFLVKGHRPELKSFRACFRSIFRIHTETGNIWTHLLGCVAFVAIFAYFLSRPSIEVHWHEKAVLLPFFGGAILCLGFSWLFHTVYCHSERVGKLFNKLDYCGIALLTMGSFVPWLYYSFYCQFVPKVIYLVLILALGTTCIVVSMSDKFASSHFRPLRAGLFVGLGLSGVVPTVHYVLLEGFWHALRTSALGWLCLMAALYIMGAVIYATRFPECIFPGKFDIWFQSHQIFHVFVVAATLVHYYGILQMAAYRRTASCTAETPPPSFWSYG